MKKKAASEKNGVSPTESQIRFLRCQAEPGMFRDELLVFMNGLDPTEIAKQIKVQMLVDKNEVKELQGKPHRNNPVNGWVQVTLAKVDGGLATVVLPQPAQPVGESMLVDLNDLKKSTGE